MEWKKIILKIVFDVVSISIPIIFLVLTLVPGIRPFRRGYFETDTSIRYPFVQQSISLGILMGFGGFVVFITVLITEIIRHIQRQNAVSTTIGHRRGCLSKIYGYVGVYLFGIVCLMSIVSLGKYSLGRLRPNFIDVCQPVVFDDDWLDRNGLGYIRGFHCSGWRSGWMDHIRMSFPSAHAGFAMYSAVFFILYLERKTKWYVGKGLRHLAQFSAVLAAWYVGTTRLSENFSHWSDVFAGYTIGAAFAGIMFFYLLKQWKPQEKPTADTQPMNALPVLQQPINVLPDQPPQYEAHYNH